MLSAVETAGAAAHLDWPRGGRESGLHFVARNRDGSGDDAAWSRAAGERSIAVLTLSAFSSHPDATQRGLVLGFANTPFERMSEAVTVLLKAWVRAAEDSRRR